MSEPLKIGDKVEYYVREEKRVWEITAKLVWWSKTKYWLDGRNDIDRAEWDYTYGDDFYFTEQLTKL